MKKLIPVLLLPFAFIVSAEEIRSFTSDGCSSFPNGTFQQQSLWLDCCVSHDLAYWKGGTEKERRQADQALQKCVAAVGEPMIAQLMLAGVRVGGSPDLPTPFRWGYGWPMGRGYKAINPNEKQQIKKQLLVLEKMIATLKQQLDESE